MWHVWGAAGVYEGSLVEISERRRHLEDLIVDGRMILKSFSKKWAGEAWIGLLCLRIGTEGGRLSMRQ